MPEQDLDHLGMIYAEFVDRAMRSQEPVTETREVGKYRRIYSAAQYDPDREVVWRADIDADHHPEWDTDPSVSFSKCYPNSTVSVMQDWSSLATGRLTGPQDLDSWNALFTVFYAALDHYHSEVDDE